MKCCPGDFDFLFPMTADLYYPIITQGLYNEIEKEWAYDRTVSCYATNTTTQEETIEPDFLIKNKEILLARSPEDFRISSLENTDFSTNVLITNIRLPSGEIAFKEFAGPRTDLGTFFELAKIEPFIGPFDTIEYYKMVWRRTENQAVSD